MNVVYGTKEWVTYILITFSKSAKEKQSDKFPRSQNQPTLYSSIVNKESIENEMDSKVKCLRYDNGGEFTSKEFMDYYRKDEIKRQFFVSRTPHDLDGSKEH
jgi:hypothetical protein